MISEIADEYRLTQIMEAVNTRTAEKHTIDLQWLLECSMIAVPVEYDGVLPHDQSSNAAEAFKASGASVLWVVNLDFEDSYELQPTMLDVFQITMKYGAMILLLMSPDTSNTILFTPEDFMVVCGDDSFVAKVTGEKPINAMNRFKDFFNHGVYSSHIRHLIEEAATRYVR